MSEWCYDMFNNLICFEFHATWGRRGAEGQRSGITFPFPISGVTDGGDGDREIAYQCWRWWALERMWRTGKKTVVLPKDVMVGVVFLVVVLGSFSPS